MTPFFHDQPRYNCPKDGGVPPLSIRVASIGLCRHNPFDPGWALNTPPKQFWDVMQQLYDIHEMLLRAANLSPQFKEAAHRLERSIVELQEAYTLDEEVP